VQGGCRHPPLKRVQVWGSSIPTLHNHSRENGWQSGCPPRAFRVIVRAASA